MARKVAIFDLDKTITKKDSYLPFLLFVLRKKPSQFKHLWSLPFIVMLYYLGIISNGILKERFFSAFCRGLHRSSLAEISDEFAEIFVEEQVHNSAIAELNYLRVQDYRVVLASASLDIYVKPIARLLGFREAEIICTQTAWFENGNSSGKLESVNCYGRNKAKAVQEWCYENGIKKIDRAYSDHHSDLSTLLLAKSAIVVNPSPKLKQLAGIYNFKEEKW